MNIEIFLNAFLKDSLMSVFLRQILECSILHYNQTPFGIAQICSTQVDPSFLKLLENKNTSC